MSKYDSYDQALVYISELRAENAQLREALRRAQEIAQTSVMLAKGGGKPDHYEALRDIRALLSTAIAKVTP
jgi:hypothetical protein